MTIDFDTTIRGVEVIVYASNFYSDRPVGINFGPEEVYAVTAKDGKDFSLTEREESEMASLAIELYYDRMQEAE